MSGRAFTVAVAFVPNTQRVNSMLDEGTIRPAEYESLKEKVLA